MYSKLQGLRASRHKPAPCQACGPPVVEQPHGAALPLLHCIPDHLNFLGVRALPLQEAAVPRNGAPGNISDILIGLDMYASRVHCQDTQKAALGSRKLKLGGARPHQLCPSTSSAE
jgi:hypothetical protein